MSDIEKQQETASDDDGQLTVEEKFNDEEDADDTSSEKTVEEIEIIEYIDIVDEGYYTPHDMLLVLLMCIVLMVAAGIGVSVFFAYENRDEINNIDPPTPAPIVPLPTLAPVASPTLPPIGGYTCELCADGGAIANPDAIVDVAGSPNCADVAARGLAGEFTQGVCELLQASAEETCGCVAGTCTVCANAGDVVRNRDGVLDVASAGFPGITSLSCGQLDSFAELGQIPDAFCPLLQEASAAECDCGPPVCTVCAEGVVRNPDGILDATAANIPGITNVTCGGLDSFAQQGAIPDNFCDLLQEASPGPCDCGEADTTTDPAPPAGDDDDDDGGDSTPFVCPICSSTIQEIQNPDGELELAGQTVTCSNLAASAATGAIEESVCPAVQALALDPCGCGVSEAAVLELLSTVAGGGINIEGRPEYLAARYLLDEDPRFVDARRQLQPEDDSTTSSGETADGNGTVVDLLPDGDEVIVDLLPEDELLPTQPGDPAAQSNVTDDSSAVCKVCAKGAIRNPDGILDVSAANITGVTQISCGALNTVAKDGIIPLTFCPLLQQATVDICECGDVVDEGGDDDDDDDDEDNGSTQNEEGAKTTAISLGDLPEEQIIQRYLLILFYFQTSSGGSQPWNTTCVWSSVQSERLAPCTFVDGQTEAPWLGPMQECQWAGVTCDEVTEQVTELKLSGIGMSGRFPAAILALPSLESIDFSLNELTGPFPREVNILTKLQNVNVFDNLFSGEIPEGIASLVDLTTVNFGKNDFTGSVSADICDRDPSLESFAVDCDEVTCADDCCVCCTDDGCEEEIVL